MVGEKQHRKGIKEYVTVQKGRARPLNEAIIQAKGAGGGQNKTGNLHIDQLVK